MCLVRELYGSRSSESCPISIFKLPSIWDTRDGPFKTLYSRAVAGKSYKAVHSVGCQLLFPAPFAAALHTTIIVWRCVRLENAARRRGRFCRVQFVFLVLHASILAAPACAHFRLSTFRRDTRRFNRHARARSIERGCSSSGEPYAPTLLLTESYREL